MKKLLIQNDKLQQVGIATKNALDKALREFATQVAADASNLTEHVDTGAMQNAFAVTMKRFSNYQEIAIAAHALNPNSEQFTEEPVTKELTAVVSNVMEYAIYHEMGTVHMSPTPMLAPAVERNKSIFGEKVKQILEQEGLAR